MALRSTPQLRNRPGGCAAAALAREPLCSFAPAVCGRRMFSKRAPNLYSTCTMPFDIQPILKGELLELRPLKPEDFHDLYAVASDPLIWEQHPAQDRYKECVFEQFFREALESGAALIAIDSKDGRVIGSSRFHGYDEEKSEVEIGWTFLARSHWGGVYNGEMKQLMIRHAFRFVSHVIFVVGPRNLRSQKAVEKIGGVRVGSRMDANGQNNFVYSLSRKE